MAIKGIINFKNGESLSSEMITSDEENGIVIVQRKGDSRILTDRYNWDEISNIIQEE